MGDVQEVEFIKDDAVVRVKARVLEETNEGSLVLFTHGSFLQELAAGGAVAHNGGTMRKDFGAADEISTCEMDSMGISIELNQFIDKIEAGNHPE